MSSHTKKANTNLKKKDLFNFEHRWKLKNWIDESKLCWYGLSLNPNAMYLLETNSEKIKWNSFCKNPSGIHIVIQNFEKINWKWFYLSKNPAIFELDYDFFHQRMNLIRKELIEKTWHPNRIQLWCLSIDELNDLN